MNKILFVCILFVTLIQCEKNQQFISFPIESIDTLQTPLDTNVIHIIELGQVYVLKNNVHWDVPFYARYYSSSYNKFFLRGKITYPNLRSESFGLFHIPCMIGKYLIELYSIENFENEFPESVFIMMQDYDQPIGDFLVDTTRNDHYIEIIRYDSIEKTVEGRFQVFLKKSPSNTQWPNVPDSIFLTEGKFHLKIQDP